MVFECDGKLVDFDLNWLELDEYRNSQMLMNDNEHRGLKLKWVKFITAEKVSIRTENKWMAGNFSSAILIIFMPLCYSPV